MATTKFKSIKSFTKNAFKHSSRNDIDMGKLMDFSMQLDELGIPQEEIDIIMEDFDASQRLGTYQLDRFIEDVLESYALKDGDVSPEFHRFL